MGTAFFDRVQTVSFTPHAAGSYSFCVTAWDPAGNSRKDCAGVAVKASTSGGGGGGCDSSYPTVCIPPPPPDLDCGDIPYTNFTVIGNDPHGFDGDGDGDGVGCET
jgi:micrococcal nuclease